MNSQVLLSRCANLRSPYSFPAQDQIFSTLWHRKLSEYLSIVHITASFPKATNPLPFRSHQQYGIFTQDKWVLTTFLHSVTTNADTSSTRLLVLGKYVSSFNNFNYWKHRGWNSFNSRFFIFVTGFRVWVFWQLSSVIPQNLQDLTRRGKRSPTNSICHIYITLQECFAHSYSIFLVQLRSITFS